MKTSEKKSQVLNGVGSTKEKITHPQKAMLILFPCAPTGLRTLKESITMARATIESVPQHHQANRAGSSEPQEPFGQSAWCWRPLIPAT